MTKAEIIAKVAKNTNTSQAQVGDVLNATLAEISNLLSEGDSITFTGFGSFVVAERAARTGRNPQTGETMQIKASRVPRFRAGKLLKEAVAGDEKKKKKK